MSDGVYLGVEAASIGTLYAVVVGGETTDIVHRTGSISPVS